MAARKPKASLAAVVRQCPQPLPRTAVVTLVDNFVGIARERYDELLQKEKDMLIAEGAMVSLNEYLAGEDI